jgi:glucose/arabinose dehydrogenase
MKAIHLAMTVAAATIVACGGSAKLPIEAGMGPNPTIPAPRTSLIPVVKVARAVGWPAGATPVAAQGLAVAPFATSLDHPRWLYVLPNGDVLVAESNAPPRPPEKGIRAYFMRKFFKKAGAAVPSANRITLLRDANGDGIAETRSILLHDLTSPFGMALVNGSLYVANADALVRFPYREGQMTITNPPMKVVDLPAGINHHWTKSLLANADGSKLYVGVGSNSNAAEKGMEIETDRAAILEIDVATGARRVFASGLRNPVGITWEPATNMLWASVNERDELGSDLVPDYMTSVREGAFYGWPYSYFGRHVDGRVKPPRPDLVTGAVVPDYALGPHTGSLGLVSSRGSVLPGFRDGMFVGQHGSWNRKPFSGYQVIFVPFAAGKPTGALPTLVLGGFLDDEGHARGRPVGLAVDRRGALLVADDVGNAIWRVTGSSSVTTR